MEIQFEGWFVAMSRPCREIEKIEWISSGSHWNYRKLDFFLGFFSLVNYHVQQVLHGVCETF